MSQHAVRILRNLQGHIERNGSTDAGTIAVLKQVIGILSKRFKLIPKKRAKARRGPMRDPKYRRWCTIQWCVVCRLLPEDKRESAHWPIDPAHTRNNGQSSKGPDSSCVPLCRAHHRQYDAGRATFERTHGVDMEALAKEHYSRYLQETGAK